MKVQTFEQLLEISVYYSHMKRLFGGHLSSSGGYINALRAAQQLNINAIQIHPSAPQRWNQKPFAAGVEDEYLKNFEASGIKKLFFHAIYLLNLAHPEERMQKLSQDSLAYSLDLISRMKGQGVIFHVGSFKHDDDKRRGLSRCAEIINRTFDAAKNDGKLLLEVAAGSGSVIGQKFEELVEIYSQVEQKERIGFALDTQHLWASGCNLEEDLDSLIDYIASSVGMNFVEAVHLNDSKTALNSKVDRHENLGQGQIGIERLTKVINHPSLKNIPFILETPAMKSLETAAPEIEVLRALLQE